MKAARHHLQSLDAFRGVTIAAMIVVNNPGDWTAVYEPLLHASWNGWTIADLVFPSFIFIMGFAMPFAFARRREGATGMAPLHGRIARRALALVLLGLLLNVVAAWQTRMPVRFPGVLQRTGIVYFVAAMMVLHTKPRTWPAIAALMMLAHWALLTLVPFDSVPAGSMTYEHNLSGYLDAMVFGRHSHKPFGDPEGILGTMTAVATALVGACAGEIVRQPRSDRTKIAALLCGGAVSIACGLAWSRVLPINKPLWTGSYVLFTSGVAAVAFAAFYWFVDVLGMRTIVRPFVWLGVNPLALYFLSELVGHAIEQGLVRQGAQWTTAKAWLYWRVFAPLSGDLSPSASLVFALLFAALWLGVAAVLYRRGIRIQV